ncbi:MAG: hypothetical protein ABIM99_01900 [Candidatus Dojkabacteria bacterium]
MVDTLFEKLAAEEQVAREHDTKPINGETLPYTPEGQVDVEALKLNYLDDFIGRYNTFLDPKAAKLEVVGRLISIAMGGRDSFINNVKEDIDDQGSKFDRLLYYLFEKFISKIDTNIKVLDPRTLDSVFVIYQELVEELKDVRIHRSIETWPHILKPGEVIEDF